GAAPFPYTTLFRSKAMVGAAASTGCTHTDTASAGMRALSSASCSVGGSLSLAAEWCAAAITSASTMDRPMRAKVCLITMIMITKLGQLQATSARTALGLEYYAG